MGTQQIPEILQIARRITDVTREKILDGEIEEGQRLTESFLADMFGVSRSPIREALRMLAHEGFVELLPYRGARVSVIRLKNVHEHYQLKAMLDGYGCYAAAQKLTEEDFATLANNIEESRCYIEEGDFEGMVSANTAFHSLIIESIDNSPLSQYYNSISQNLRRYAELSLGNIDRWGDVIDGHKAIYDALLNKDAVGAFEAANKHAFEAMDRVTHQIGKKNK